MSLVRGNCSSYMVYYASMIVVMLVVFPVLIIPFHAYVPRETKDLSIKQCTLSVCGIPHMA